MTGPASGFVPVLHAGTDTGPDEADTLAAAEAVAAALRRLGCETAVLAVGLDLSVLEALAERAPLAVFNLVEAMRGDDGLIGIVPAVLEHLGVPFTGGRAEAFAATLSKCRTKQSLRAAGLPTPDWSPDGTTCDATRRYIVKADIQHGSAGMDAGSVLPGSRAADEIAARRDRHGIRFFAERFVEGREFNVALMAAREGVRLLPIQEIVFHDCADGRPRIVDFAAKWDPGSENYHRTVRRYGIEQREPVLAGRLAEISLAAWSALSLSGYVRVDFRVDGKGRPYVLEVNVNPAITPDAGLAAAAAQAGLGYDGLVGTILAQAAGRAAVERLPRHLAHA